MNCFTSLFAVVMASTAQPFLGLGETFWQCQDRYGAPKVDLAPTADSVFREAWFYIGSYKLVIRFLNGKEQAVIITKTDGSEISHRDIDSFLSEQAKLSSWTIAPSNQGVSWVNPEGDRAFSNPHIFSIVTAQAAKILDEQDRAYRLKHPLLL